ncbi:hydroxyquinol 1,2-dioxygenase [Rhodobacterales bacterium HKCCE2091]|nr:hydroxyquinol 1,2-dioxygenase [Rhodobacterales bacterium HKCCE2091]
MRDFNQTTITEAVLDRFAATPDPRLREIMQSLTRHLHDFARDVQLTIPEWERAVGFLTRTGQMCDDKRQEFILLSDTLGLSMLIDAINHPTEEGATQTTVLGPFYVDNPPVRPDGADISGGEAGEPMWIDGQVTDAAGTPLAGSTVDVWQSDDDGYYDVQKPGAEADLRARFVTDAEGRFRLWSILPSAYPIPDDGPVGDMLKATGRHPWRPAHVHFMIAAEGFQTLVTHLFIDGDTYLDSDAVFGVKDSLIVAPVRQPAGEGPGGRRLDADWYRLDHRFGLSKPR